MDGGIVLLFKRIEYQLRHVHSICWSKYIAWYNQNYSDTELDRVSECFMTARERKWDILQVFTFCSTLFSMSNLHNKY